MVNITIGKLDKGYDLQITIHESDGSVKDLTGFTGTFKMWRPSTPDTIVATIVGGTSSVAGVYHCVLSTDVATTSNYYEGSLLMTAAGVQDTVENFLITIPGGAYYCTLTELKGELNITGSEHDYKLQALVQQVQKLIDNYCHRTFMISAAGVRYFDGSDDPMWIDDCTSVTNVRLDEESDGTWSSTMACTGSTAAWPTTAAHRDYVLKPYNSNPKTELVLSSNSQYSGFAEGIVQGVMVTGVWGFDTTIPEDIRRAAIIQCCRWFKRSDSAYASMIGPTELGVMQTFSGLDPDVKLILTPYVRTQYAR